MKETQQYYLRRGTEGAAAGPYTASEVKAMWAKGAIHGEVFYSRRGGDWKPITDLIQRITGPDDDTLSSPEKSEGVDEPMRQWRSTTRSPVGDREGEHQGMERGRYGADIHVFFAFLLETAVVSWLIWRSTTGGHLTTDQEGLTPAVAASGILGLVVALLVFWDRWKCTEAYSSRFCSGVANLSIFYVPVVALVYANTRAYRRIFDPAERRPDPKSHFIRTGLIVTVCTVIGIILFGLVTGRIIS